MKQVDYRQGERVTLCCLIGNVVLTAIKGIVGVTGGSQAMVADALHSGSDIVATLAVYISVRIAQKPADKDHLYGHGKIEPLAAAFVGLSLLVTAALIARGIVIGIVRHSFVTPSVYALVVAAVSIISKEVMFRVTIAAGRRSNSPSILANAWEHRSDAYSSIGTFTGILGSILGANFRLEWLRYMDSIAGIAVSVLIIKIGAAILLEAAHNLMDAAPGKEVMARIAEIAGETEGVKKVSWVKGRYVGRQIVVDMAVNVNGQNTVEEGHEITVLIRDRILERIYEVGEVLIHLNPH